VIVCVVQDVKRVDVVISKRTNSVIGNDENKATSEYQDGFDFDLQKMLEYDEEEENRKYVEERNREIQMLLMELEELKDLFADQVRDIVGSTRWWCILISDVKQAQMMVEQGQLIETIQHQTEQAEQATKQAVTQLAKAQSIDFSRYVKTAMLIGAVLGGIAGGAGGAFLAGPIGAIPCMLSLLCWIFSSLAPTIIYEVAIAGAGAGGAFGKIVGNAVANKLTRTAEKNLFQQELMVGVFI